MRTEPSDIAKARKRLNVIAADDARAQRALIQELLSSIGHQIRVAMNGAEAYCMACESPPDLLITDLEMPSCNGFDLIQAFRHAEDRRLRQIPIIVCSSRGEVHSLNRALDFGATSFVTKPLHFRELKMAIENLQPS